MWMRYSSTWCCDVDDHLPVENVLGNQGMQGIGRNKIHWSMEEVFQGELHIEQFEEPQKRTVRLEGNQHVNVARRREIVAQDGPEEGEFLHLVALRDRCEGRCIDGDWQMSRNMDLGHRCLPPSGTAVIAVILPRESGSSTPRVFGAKVGRGGREHARCSRRYRP